MRLTNFITLFPHELVRDVKVAMEVGQGGLAVQYMAVASNLLQGLPQGFQVSASELQVRLHVVAFGPFVPGFQERDAVLFFFMGDASERR